MNENCFMGDAGGLNPEIRAILQYNTSAGLPNTTAWNETMDSKCVDLNLTELVPLSPKPAMPPTSDLFVRIDVSFQTVAGDLNFGFMNSTSWIPLNNSNILLKSASDAATSIQGIDQSFDIKNQFVYAIPTIKTVEYISCL